jgi:hypothetical protein
MLSRKKPTLGQSDFNNPYATAHGGRDKKEALEIGHQCQLDDEGQTSLQAWPVRQQAGANLVFDPSWIQAITDLFRATARVAPTGLPQ